MSLPLLHRSQRFIHILVMKNFPALASAFRSKVSELGFTFTISESGEIVRIHKSFEKGNMDEFVKCDMNAPWLLSMIPTSGGSMWGTDGGSVGGYSAVLHGNFTMNVSGVKKRFVTELKKQIQ